MFDRIAWNLSGSRRADFEVAERLKGAGPHFETEAHRTSNVLLARVMR